MKNGKIVLVSFTPLNSAGGVPRWNRDFIKCFGYENEVVHYSWDDVSSVFGNSNLPEWEKAKILSHYLWYEKKVSVDDLVIGDGFWADGYGQKTVSVCHGIWGHLIKEEADAGKTPDFPFHHAAQIEFRKRFTAKNGKLVAVSEFIQYQMKQQWNFDSTVINNAIDTKLFQSSKKKLNLSKPLVIHGINDSGNTNKGWDFIEEVCKCVDAHVMSLDEAHQKFGEGRDKYHVLSLADLVLIPSGYEGNSYFALESLSCNVPVIAYDVGLFWELSPYNKNNTLEGFSRSIGIGNLFSDSVGLILSRKERDKIQYANEVKKYIENKSYKICSPAGIAESYSIDNFKYKWKKYITENFGWPVK